MTTNLLILSFYFVFRYRLCPTYSYGFIIIINYWSVITVITSTTIITNIVHVICVVTITIINWDSKYNNIGSVTFSFFISPICKIIYPSNLIPIHQCRSQTIKGRSVVILSLSRKRDIYINQYIYLSLQVTC